MESPKKSSDLRTKAVKGVIWTAIENWGSKVISFVVFLLLARLLEPKTFGLVALTSIFFAFMQVFLDQGFSQAIIQRKDLNNEHLDTAFWTNIAIAFLLLGLSVVGAGFIATLFKEPQLIPIIRWLSLSFLFAALNSVQSAILSRNLAFKSLSLRTLIATVAGGVVGITMALLGFGVWSLVGQQLANGLVGVLVLWWSSNWRPGFNVSKKHFQELFAFGINVVGMNALNFLNTRSDDFLIGYFLGSVALGYYTVAYRILLIVNQLMVGTIQKTALPVFSRLQAEPERLRQALYTAIGLTTLVAFPVFIGLSALAPELVIVMFGEQWKPSIPVMQILNLIGLLYASFNYNNPIIMALGKPAWGLGLNLMQAVGNVIGFAIAVRWGIIAVALAYLIRAYLTAPITLWIVHKLIRINFSTYLKQQAAPLLASLAMVVSIFAVKHFLSQIVSLQILLTICIGLGTVVYILTIMLIAPQLYKQATGLFSSVLPKFMWKKS
ncbi:lipopolysaccharide biosynthesis protein [Calothrix sp. FACHB-1219]|uniref:lipopolysaccharide biosynthesis protein n=1 Tax=unclassified Calothrix TaxID=2619626 RepID=UPI0016836E64|nr:MULTISPECIES: lipopolysaccharide biosynthesis protein [unclassified Calothrix]MBD2205072.1 lipopolysaccharide biosynthesis protein [Calothrix sp. FACHB-168]MBD2219870.1 lipopolysaccharide biosynthesis protein [Calothrix sp. FACHB-1219]